MSLQTSTPKTLGHILHSHSPLLAPLSTLEFEYRTNSRRGSLTDPALHASPYHTHDRDRTSSSDTYFNSPPFRFGQNTPARPTSPPHYPAESSLLASRRPLNGHLIDPLPADDARLADEPELMNVDNGHARRDSVSFAHDSHAQPPGARKRKKSDDSSGVLTPADETSSPPKRRGSAIDTQRIAQLSLRDRRNSVDSRGSSQSQRWANNGRRDSTSSMLSSTSSTAHSHSAEGESERPLGLASFTWAQHDPNVSARAHELPPAHTLAAVPRFLPDRRMSVPNNLGASSTGPARALRSRSRPPSRQALATNFSDNDNGSQDEAPPSPTDSNNNNHSSKDPAAPYSRSPELRVSHKLAERKRRKEMKELFDELRDHLPAERNMKSSKWEILSKSIDFVAQLKQSHQDMAREIDMLRSQLETRQGHASIPSFAHRLPVAYQQGPPGAIQLPPLPHHPSHSGTISPMEVSRPSSSQNSFSPEEH